VIINSVLKNEAVRNNEMIQQYEQLISTLPKGSLICRNNEYYYLKYRKNGKVCDDYIGKNKERISLIKEHIGPVADDNVYQSIRLFETGAYDAEYTVKKLKTEVLHDQWTLHSDEILKYLNFIEAKEVR